MTDIPFDSVTARHGLPLLFAGQAQKETFVNEALARIDALLCLAFDGFASVPPADPADGQTYIVAADPSGDWSGKAAQIAARHAGTWLYFTPRTGMRAFDQSSGREHIYRGAWLSASKPAEPTGGSVIDAETRQAISRILQELQRVGIFS